MANTAIKHKRSKGHSATIPSKIISCSEPVDESWLGTPEEIARGNAEWDAIVAETTPEKIAFLKQMFANDAKRGGIAPLDFTDK